MACRRSLHRLQRIMLDAELRRLPAGVQSRSIIGQRCDMSTSCRRHWTGRGGRSHTPLGRALPAAPTRRPSRTRSGWQVTPPPAVTLQHLSTAVQAGTLQGCRRQPEPTCNLHESTWHQVQHPIAQVERTQGFTSLYRLLQDIRHPRVKTIMSRRFDFAKRIGCGESTDGAAC